MVFLAIPLFFFVIFLFEIMQQLSCFVKGAIQQRETREMSSSFSVPVQVKAVTRQFKFQILRVPQTRKFWNSKSYCLMNLANLGPIYRQTVLHNIVLYSQTILSLLGSERFLYMYKGFQPTSENIEKVETT